MSTFLSTPIFSSILPRPGPFSGSGPEKLRPHSDSWGSKFRPAGSRPRSKSVPKSCALRVQNRRFGRPRIRIGLEPDWASIDSPGSRPRPKSVPKSCPLRDRNRRFGRPRIYSVTSLENGFDRPDHDINWSTTQVLSVLVLLSFSHHYSFFSTVTVTAILLGVTLCLLFTSSWTACSHQSALFSVSFTTQSHTRLSSKIPLQFVSRRTS